MTAFMSQDFLNTATGGSTGDWQSALLAAIGAPNTPTNRLALTYWHQSEGTQPSTNNWLAISDGANLYPHAGLLAQGGSSSPIYAFPDQATGVQATAHFLGYGYYTNVVAAFRQNAGLAAIWQAINGSPWCKGCQGGQYPVALAQAAQGSPPAVTDDGTSTSGGTATDTAGHLAVSAKSGRSDHCLWPDITMPGNVPNIQGSWGCALMGGTALVVGGLLLLFGATLAVGFALPRLPALPQGRTPMRDNA